MSLTKVTGVGFDGTSYTITIGKLIIPILKKDYSDMLEPGEFLRYMGSQTQDEQGLGTYKTSEFTLVMSSRVFRVDFLPAMPQNGGGNLLLPIVVGRQHPTLGDDSDLLSGCRFTNWAAALENSNKLEETPLKGTVTQIFWGDSRRTINYLTAEQRTTALTSGF